MEYKLLSKKNLKLMLEFVDDEYTKYDLKQLKSFISVKNNYAFIAKDNDKITGFSYGYVLTHPNGEKVFYFDAIDVVKNYQSKGVGTNLMIFARDYAKSLGCKEMFLVTNKSNKSACKCYEKAGGVCEANDDVVYVYDFNEAKE